MKFNRAAAVLAALGMTAAVHAEPPTTAPSTAPAGELMQPKSEMAGYGVEQYRIVSEPGEVVSVLRNGVTVIVKRVPSTAVAVRGLVGTGGVYEGKWLGGGLSHLLEHLVAGGSSERRTEAENRNLLQQIGNNSNAYTTEDRTAFFVNTTPEHTAQAIDLVTGWLTGAKITVPEYRREYEVVQRELEMGKGEPDRQFYYMSAMNRYHVSPARVPVIGYQEVIQGLSRDDVYSYYKLAYEPHNMIFAVVGDIDPEVALRAVERNVADLVPARVFTHDIPPEPPVLSPRTLVATFPKLGQARLELGFEGVSVNSPDMYALDLLAEVLGGGDGATLVEDLRDDKQLASEVSVNDDTPAYATGTFTVDLQLDPDKVPAATAEALAVLERCKTTPIDAGRLKRAKTQMRVAHVRGSQTVEDISTTLADDYMSTADVHFSDRYVDRIDAVTAEQIQTVARKYFSKSHLLTTCMLPSEFVGAKGLPRAEQLLRGGAPTSRPVHPAAVASAVRRVDLGNGVTLLVKRVATSPLVQVGMYSLGGVTAEDATNNGIGNLAMAMLTRGTKTRSAEQIAEQLDAAGAEVDAGCGNNSWYWTASGLSGDFDQLMGLYADVVLHPAFADAELAEMKQRIDADIAGEDANWDAQAMRFFKQSFYGPMDSPYQFMPIGTAATVDKLTAEDLRKWYEGKVLGGHKVLAIYGDVDPDHVEAVARKLFGTAATTRPAGGGTYSLPARKIHLKGDPATRSAAAMAAAATRPGTPSVTVTAVKVQKTESALAGVVIGFKSDGVIGEPGNYPLDVGQTMAGGWGYPTGYLFETLRGKGLVYDVYAANNPGRGGTKTPGNFFVFAGCDPSKVNEVVDLSLENIARLQGKPADVQPDWFERSKLLITTADALDSETLASQVSQAALDELYGFGFDFHRQFAPAITGVTLDQVRAAAAGRLRECVVTVSTPNPEAVSAKPGVRTYDSFPPVDLTPRGVQHSNSVVKP
jgi:zinc protease